jgi:hypothetical protein
MIHLFQQNTYPNLPAYPAGNDVNGITNCTNSYVGALQLLICETNKDNLVVYEVLIRNFDANEIFNR